MFSTIFIVSMTVGVTGWLWHSHEHARFDEEVRLLTDRYFESRKARIRNEVDRVIDYIAFKRTTTEKRLRQTIRMRVQGAHSIAESLYRANSPLKSDDEIKALIRRVLRAGSLNRKGGYYFAVTREGICEFNHGHPELEGRKVEGFTHEDGRSVFTDDGKFHLDEGEDRGYLRYLIGKPDDPRERKYRKISYMKLFEPLGWFIGTGEYLGDVEKEIQEEVLARIGRIRFGGGGFIFVHTFAGKNLSHANAEIRGKNVWNMSGGPEGTKYIQKMTELGKNESGAYLNYFSGMKETKGVTGARIGFVRSVPDWGWTVGTAFDVDDLETRISKRRKELSTRLEAHLVRIFFTLASLVFVVSLFAKYIAYKSGVSFRHFTSFFDKAAVDSGRIDRSLLHFSEFSALAGAANRMIDQRKRVEAVLEETRDNLVNAQRIARMGNWAYYPSTGEYYWADEIFTILGIVKRKLSRDEILGLIDPADRDRFVSCVLRLVSENVPISLEFRMRKQDGTLLHLHARGEMVEGDKTRAPRAVGSIQDITEIRWTEERLGESEEKFRAITLAAQNAIVMMDDRGRLSYWNRAAERIFGYSADEALGRELHRLIVPEGYREAFERGFALFLETGGGDFVGKHVEKRAVRKDGSLFPVELSLSGVKINGSRHAVGIIRDISDRKAAREERERLQKELLQSRKMESLGTLAGGIAHDFNNLLFPIVGFTEMTKNDIPEDSVGRCNLDEVLKAASRARELVRQILTFSRKKTHRQSAVGVRGIIHETLKLLRASLPATIEIRESVAEGGGSVLGDETQIGQVVMNLCTNAYHAMEKTGGVLTITLERAEMDARRGMGGEPKEKADAGYLALCVGDTGHGMEEHEIDRIFEPYYSTKDKDKGTGLGLSVVHGIVKAHRGTVDVASSPGKGTLFTVFLPLMGDAPVPAPPKPRRTGMLRGSEHLMVVDDEPQIVMMMEKLLTRLGYGVTAFTDAGRALEAVRNTPDEFDLLVSDLTMPGMTGDRLAEEVVSIRNDLPVILCTGFSDMLPEGRAERLKIGRILSKPVPVAELTRAIRELLDKAVKS